MKDICKVGKGGRRGVGGFIVRGVKLIILHIAEREPVVGCILKNFSVLSLPVQ